MKSQVTKAILVALTESIKGTSFVGLKNYATKRGEVANYTILIGASYENCMVHDYNSLAENQEKIFGDLAKDYKMEDIETAYKNIADSLEIRLSTPEVKEKLRAEGNATLNASEAQSDAYEQIGKGVKVNKESGEVHIYGVQISKTVVTPAPPTATKPRQKGLIVEIQDKIKKICGFRQDQLRTFIIDNLETLNIQGFSITQK